MSGFSVDTDSLGRAGRQVQKASEPLPRTAPALAAAGSALPGGAAASLLPEVGVAIDAWVTAWHRATESLGSGLSISATGYAVSQQQAAQGYDQAAQAHDQARRASPRDCPRAVAGQPCAA